MARHGGAPAAQDRSHSAPGLNPSSRAELAEGGREDANRPIDRRVWPVAAAVGEEVAGGSRLQHLQESERSED